MAEISGFHKVAHSNTSLWGVVPFRLEANLNANGVDQIDSTISRKSSAKSFDDAVDFYEKIGSAAVAKDGARDRATVREQEEDTGNEDEIGQGG